MTGKDAESKWQPAQRHPWLVSPWPWPALAILAATIAGTLAGPVAGVIAGTDVFAVGGILLVISLAERARFLLSLLIAAGAIALPVAAHLL
jgi:hypothetical protein